MKKILSATIALIAIFFSCNKTSESPPGSVPSEKEAIESAYNYFKTQIAPAQNGKRRPDKFPLWSNATVSVQSSGSLVTVPVFVTGGKFIYTTDGSRLSATELTSLKIYLDGEGKKRYEVETRVPAGDYVLGTLPFKGVTKIEDWNGNFIRATVNKNNTIASGSFRSAKGKYQVQKPAQVIARLQIGTIAGRSMMGQHGHALINQQQPYVWTHSRQLAAAVAAVVVEPVMALLL